MTTPTYTPSTIIIELVGSYTARHAESGLTVDRGDRMNRMRPKSAISPLCRLLLTEGYLPDEHVMIIRKAFQRENYISVFNRDRTLATWAALDCVEAEDRGARVVKHRPFPSNLSKLDM